MWIGIDSKYGDGEGGNIRARDAEVAMEAIASVTIGEVEGIITWHEAKVKGTHRASS